MLALAKAEKQRSCLGPLSLVAQKLWTPEIKSGPEIVGHLTPALGKLRHDLLVQPYVHFRRAVERASVAEFLRQLLSGAKTAVQLQQFHQINDRPFPIIILVLFFGELCKNRFDVSF